jgi:DNA-binding MarR family transcriptional regulator
LLSFKGSHPLLWLLLGKTIMRYTDILIQIRQIIRSVNLESKRLEKEYGISIPQLLCLNFLNEKEHFRATHKEIKDFLKLNASTVSGIISRLERKGYIARLPKAVGTDQRVGLITITARGAELLEQAPEPLHEQLSLKLKTLSPAQLQQLQEAFDTIIDFLDINELDAAPILTAAPNLSKEGPIA